MQTSDSRKRQAERADVEALAEVLDRHVTDAAFESGCRLSCGYDGVDLTEHMAEAVLASDWLAGHVAREQAEALREAADAIRDCEGNALMRELLKLLCNDTARMAADWAESVCRDRADRLARGEQ